MSQLREVVFAGGSLRHGVLPTDGTGRNKTHLPSGRRSPEGAGKERQGVCLPRIREGVQPVEDIETAREAQRREWNRRVAYIQDLKEAFLTGELIDAAYRTKLERA